MSSSSGIALRIEPLRRPVDATVELPGSKSYTNRALLIAALAEGRSVIRRALFSDDTRAMHGALSALGINVRPSRTPRPTPLMAMVGPVRARPSSLSGTPAPRRDF